jgi:ribosomal-protein-alanine N-acetyltransferase
MIRVATTDDAAAIAALEAQSADHPWTIDSVRSMLGLSTTRAWLYCAPEPRGYLLASAVVDEGELLTIGVRPDARRGGIASALMSELDRCWRQASVAFGFLEVRTDNTPALALYARHGWRPDGRRPDYYGPGRDALKMVWRAP